MLRPDYAIISDWINPGTRVLDLGCGDGELMRHLIENRQISGYGIEIDEASIPICIRNGINVIQSDLDEGLADFENDSFDHVVLSMTLQSVSYPDRLLDEMLRVGKEGIVTFPNFGHWIPRTQLAFRGRMPVSRAIPHEWFDTPNIHLCTVRDFEDLCERKGIAVLERRTSDTEQRGGGLRKFMPNLFGEIALYRFARR